VLSTDSKGLNTNLGLEAILNQLENVVISQLAVLVLSNITQASDKRSQRIGVRDS